MNISDMIVILEKLKEKHGDLPVHITTDYSDDENEIFDPDIIIEYDPAAKCYIDESWETRRLESIVIK